MRTDLHDPICLARNLNHTLAPHVVLPPMLREQHNLTSYGGYISKRSPARLRESKWEALALSRLDVKSQRRHSADASGSAPASSPQQMGPQSSWAQAMTATSRTTPGELMPRLVYLPQGVHRRQRCSPPRRTE